MLARTIDRLLIARVSVTRDGLASDNALAFSYASSTGGGGGGKGKPTRN